MDVVVERCAGLDVGKDEVVGCVRWPSETGKSRRSELRVFPTFTSGLEELAEWLTGHGVEQVVMEATGQYWKPVWYQLEDRGFDLKLVNAKHVNLACEPRRCRYESLKMLQRIDLSECMPSRLTSMMLTTGCMYSGQTASISRSSLLGITITETACRLDG